MIFKKTFYIDFFGEAFLEPLSGLLWQPSEAGLVPLQGFVELVVFSLRSLSHRKASLCVSIHIFFHTLHKTLSWAASIDGKALEEATRNSEQAPHDVDLSGYRLLHLRV